MRFQSWGREFACGRQFNSLPLVWGSGVYRGLGFRGLGFIWA